MKRIYGVIAGLLLIAGFLPVAPVGAQSTSNFRISSYDIQYELSRDSESRSVLKTTETITAEFPSYDQNHGLERALPTKYDGHSTSLSIVEVTNGAGGKLEYSAEDRNGVKVLRIGNADTYVHGTQRYQIVYMQRDVTKFFANTDRDEWYWDTNGTEWGVPIDTLTVQVKIDAALARQLVGTPVCYQGSAGSSDRCAVEQTGEGYTTTATGLRAGENVTLAFGFPKGTFGQYQQSLFEKLQQIWIIVAVVASVVGAALFIILTVQFVRRANRSSETNPVAVEFIPPKEASVMVSSQVVAPAGAVFSAQLIDLAVRHYIAVIETSPKAGWRAAKYAIEIQTDLSPLYDEEKEIISDMFGHLPKVGERLALETLRNNLPYSRRTLDNDKKLSTLVETTYGLRQKSKQDSHFFYRWAIVLGVMAVLTLTPWLIVFVIITASYGLLIRPLTDKGLALRRYLLGLRTYIKASEAERLKFLQGPDTAQKVQEHVDVDNPGQLVKLYERVLPYAILFGYERQWSARLGDYYQQAGEDPSWYHGSTAFNAVVFASAMQSFSQSATYSSGSSSSSGGSSGGGSSGGGGGGGGGGGW